MTETYRNPEPPDYSPTRAAAFSMNSDPMRTYRLTIALERWPVWAMIERSEAPAIAAEVASPARTRRVPKRVLDSMRHSDGLLEPHVGR